MKEIKFIERPYFMFENKVYNVKPKTIWYNLRLDFIKYIIDLIDSNENLKTLELSSEEVFETKEDLLKSL